MPATARPVRRPTFDAHIEFGPVVTAVDKRGREYSKSTGCLVTRADGQTARRTVMAFGQSRETLKGLIREGAQATFSVYVGDHSIKLAGPPKGGPILARASLLEPTLLDRAGARVLAMGETADVEIEASDADDIWNDQGGVTLPLPIIFENGRPIAHAPIYLPPSLAELFSTLEIGDHFSGRIERHPAGYRFVALEVANGFLHEDGSFIDL